MPALNASLTHKWIAYWIAACCLCVFAMVAVGGLTRLTESGLSIVEWKPVTGVLPPFGEAAWSAEFEKYRQFPEYQQKNAGMSLEEFKGIFWLEYWHRVLGRVTGLIVLVPLIAISARRLLPGREVLHLWGIAALIGLQGLVGWVMVKSGLIDRPAVSHLKLTLHLGMAFAIFTLLFVKLHHMLIRAGIWPEPVPVTEPVKTMTLLFATAVFLQVLLGGLVAGLDAGRIYNTFPLMEGSWMPAEAMQYEPVWRNFLENHAMVQFQHRMGAYGLVTLFAGLAWTIWRSGAPFYVRRLIFVMAGVLALQICLGIFTVLYEVPVGVASKHQMVALILYSFALQLNLSCRADRLKQEKHTLTQVKAV